MDIETLKDNVKELVKQPVGNVSNSKIDAVYRTVASEVSRRIILDELCKDWTQTLTASTPNYDLPDDFYAFITLHVGTKEIEPIEITEYERYYREEGKGGSATMGTVWNGQLWLYKIPSAADVAYGRYQRKITYLDEIADEHIDLFIKGMEARCYRPGTPERAEALREFQQAMTQVYVPWKKQPYQLEQSVVRATRWAEINDMQ